MFLAAKLDNNTYFSKYVTNFLRTINLSHTSNCIGSKNNRLRYSNRVVIDTIGVGTRLIMGGGANYKIYKLSKTQPH